ncbi:flavodoxin family protein [Rickettsia endosymbiont of Halotydeus destructor]|uniref:flavodoxin family protein n=1 Tax=Rickettsia endosymbiont of Halotydeus destructor TaxID=2996754 RepID=UPI003BAF0AB7
MTVKVVIIYYSGYGHTAKVAEAVHKGVSETDASSSLIQISKNNLNNIDWDSLDAADAIIFGAPTYMGSIAGPFKVFMDATSIKWGEQKWKDKIAAGFTNSASYSGDKLCSIQQLFHLAMQHGMIWVGQGENAPQFADHEMPNHDITNRLGSWSGLMTQANHKSSPDMAPPSGDLTTAILFGKRVVNITKKLHGI